MFQLKIMGFILLFSSTIPLISMSEINQTNNVSSPLNVIVVPIEAAIFTAVTTLPQAMMYVPFKEAVMFTMHSGVLTGCISTVGYALPSLVLDYILDNNQTNYSVRRKKLTVEWQRPLFVSLAILTTCFMLCMNYREFTHNYGI